jgi:hypothetical protein
MAEETTDPGFIASLTDALKSRNESPIPQKWLDEILALNKSMDTRLTAIAKFAKDEYERNTVKISVLESLSESVKLSFKESVVNAFKEFDKDTKNTEATKEEERKYKERNEQKKKDRQEENKQLAEDISEKISAAATGAAGASTEEPVITAPALPGETAAEKAIEEIDVQPVSIEQIQEPALKSLQNMFVGIFSNIKSPKEATAATKGGELPTGVGGFLESIGTGLQKLGTKEALLGAGTLIALGLALVVAAKGMQEFVKVDFASLAKGFLTLLGLVAITKLLASSTVQMLIGAGAIIALGAALFISAKGFQAFGAVDWGMIGKGIVALIALGGVAALFGAFVKIIVPGAIAIGALGLAFIPFGFGLQMIAKGLQAFASVDWTMIFKGFTALAGFGAIAGLLSFAIIPMAGFGLALLPFSLGMFLLAKALTAFADVSWEMIKTGMLALGGLGLVAGVLMPAAIAMGAFGIAMLPFSISMFLLAKALTAFADVSWEMIAMGMKAIIGLGAVTVLLAPAAIAMGAFGIAMLPFSISMFLLAKALTAFANVTWDMISTGMDALTGLGVTALKLFPAATAMGLFGLALIPFSIGMYVLAKALTAFAEVEWSMIQTGMDALTGLGITALKIFPAAAALGAFGIALLPFSISLMLLAKAIKMFAEVDLTMIDTAIIALQRFGVVGGVLGLLAAPLALFGVALIPFGLGLMVLTKGLTSFLSVDLSKMEPALAALKAFGLVGGLLGLLAIPLALFGLALIPFGFGLSILADKLTSFLAIDWKNVNESLIVLLKFGLIGSVLGLASPFLLLGAAALTIFGVALIPFTEGLMAVTEPFNAFVTQLERVSKISAGDIGALSLSIVALGAAIAGFGAGSAVAGIGNFVGGLFSSLSGQKSPIEQLIAIGEQASNIDKVIGSIGTLKESLAGLGEIKANLDPLKQFVDVINSVSLAKAAAIAAALAVTAPAAALAASSARPAAPAPAVSSTRPATPAPAVSSTRPATTSQTFTPKEETAEEVPAEAEAAKEYPRVETDQGPAIPVVVVPTKTESPAAEELVKLNENIENVATTPALETPIVQQYSDNLKEVSNKLEELIASIKPLLENMEGGSNIVMPNDTTTIVANAPTVANIGNDINRDVPYIERNKYRQTAMYARGLL